ncbi:hypothetical protein B0A49_08009 [Cryomyces minteri]|uniref:C2H2-type domain-containing protein n=1 Tax=Cryomyces minteri TaxID=331657 RepID=A0A4U0X433_9PEZI|nr:hypothetical protein B0A49_08009 [Cryomyces minteri]
MDMSGFMPSYNLSSRSGSSYGSSRAFQGPHLDLTMPMLPSPSLLFNSMPFQNYAYGFDTLPAPPFDMQRPFNTSFSAMPDFSQIVTYPEELPDYANQSLDTHTDSNSCVTNSDQRSPVVKAEVHSPVQPHQIFHDVYSVDTLDSSSPTESDDSNDTNFSTDVDTLMKAIQAKSRPTQQRQRNKSEKVGHQILKDVASSRTYDVDSQATCESGEPTRSSAKAKKSYQCTMPDCSKRFYQKTHLEIHTRAHTGVKPFLCKEPTCGQRFSQLGNLKTHERRHTGERPYHCDICGKTFAQRGNVRAHKIVHQQTKPFTCMLDECGKQFTQLGNLKSHQNKFHTHTLKALTLKFASIREGDPVTAQDKELWEYFAALYKNSNKGIKGRGKDRRISNTGLGIKLEGSETSHDGSRRSSYASSTSNAESYGFASTSSEMDFTTIPRSEEQLVQKIYATRHWH